MAVTLCGSGLPCQLDEALVLEVTNSDEGPPMVSQSAHVRLNESNLD